MWLCVYDMYYYFAQRPTLQYDGLHDRALKHYFSLPEVRVKLTQMGPVSIGDERCKIVCLGIDIIVTEMCEQWFELSLNEH